MKKYTLFAILIHFSFLLVAQLPEPPQAVDIVTENGIHITFVIYDFPQQRKKTAVINDSQIKLEYLEQEEILLLLKGWTEPAIMDSVLRFRITDLYDAYSTKLTNYGNVDIFADNNPANSKSSFMQEVLSQYKTLFNISESVTYDPIFHFDVHARGDSSFFVANNPLDLFTAPRRLNISNMYSLSKVFDGDIIHLDEYSVQDLNTFLHQHYSMYCIFEDNADLFKYRVVKKRITFDRNWTPNEVISYLLKHGYDIKVDTQNAIRKFTRFVFEN